MALSNLHYERASILLNLACLFCQLGTCEDRVSEEGIKRAVTHFAVCDVVLLASSGAKFPLSDEERGRDHIVPI